MVNVRNVSQFLWMIFGPKRIITKSEAGLEKLTKPALDLYKRYLGDKAKE
jgi:hypothetical protein